MIALTTPFSGVFAPAPSQSDDRLKPCKAAENKMVPMRLLRKQKRQETTLAATPQCSQARWP